MKKLFFISLLILLVSIPGYLLFSYYNPILKEDENVVSSDTKIATSDGITVEYKYLGNNQWDYYLYGDLPTCYVKSVIVWSDDEEVPLTNMRLRLISSIPEIDCKDDIRKYEYNGTFEASEKANLEIVNLEMNRLGAD